MINYAIDVPGGWQIEGQLFAMFRVFRVHFSSSEMLATFCVSGAFRVARVPCSGMFRVVRVACSGYVPGAFLTTAMLEENEASFFRNEASFSVWRKMSLLF